MSTTNAPPLETVRDLVRTYEILRATARGRILDVDPCRLGLPDLYMNRLLSTSEKSSASNTLVAFGRLAGKDVAVKLSFPSLSADDDNSLFVEREIYRKIVPAMLRWTPNLVGYVGEYVCTDFSKFLKSQEHPPELKGRILAHLQMMRRFGLDREYDMTRAVLLVTEKSGGRQLSEWLHPAEMDQMSNVDRVEFSNDILLQLAYTLGVFERVRFMHNDLHSGNVFVEKLDRPVTYRIRLTPTNDVIEQSISYLVRIFDFDRSALDATSFLRDDPATNVVENRLLSRKWCPANGDCNEYTPNRDWAQIIFWIYQAVRWPYLTDIVPVDILQRDIRSRSDVRADAQGKLSFFASSCVCVDSKCSTCTMDKDALRNRIQSPINYLRHRFSIQRDAPVVAGEYALPPVAAEVVKG